MLSSDSSSGDHRLSAETWTSPRPSRERGRAPRQIRHVMRNNSPASSVNGNPRWDCLARGLAAGGNDERSETKTIGGLQFPHDSRESFVSDNCGRSEVAQPRVMSEIACWTFCTDRMGSVELSFFRGAIHLKFVATPVRPIANGGQARGFGPRCAAIATPLGRILECDPAALRIAVMRRDYFVAAGSSIGASESAIG